MEFSVGRKISTSHELQNTRNNVAVATTVVVICGAAILLSIPTGGASLSALAFV